MKNTYWITIIALLVASAAVGLKLNSPMSSALVAQMGRLQAEPSTPFSTGLLSFLNGLVYGDIKTVTYTTDADVSSALQNLKERSLLVVLSGDWITQDHTGLPFVSVDPKSKLTKLNAFLPYMNTMSSILQKVTPQKLIPFTVSTFAVSDNAFAADTYVIIDLHNGFVYIRDDAAATLDKVPENDLHESYKKFSAHVEARAAEHGDVQFNHPSELFKAFGMPLAHLLINPWVLCTACMLVLVFLAPLAANYILINLALYLCSAFNLTDTTCTALWSSAAALVFVSLPLMAYGIFTVCGLYQCSHQHVTTAAAAAL